MFFEGLSRWTEAAGRLLFPVRCPICDEVLPDQLLLMRGRAALGICQDCIGRVQYVLPPRCFRCGKHLQCGEEEFCKDCQSIGHIYVSGRALYEYKSVSSAIARFKYGGRREYARVFAEELAFCLGDFIRRVQPDALVPVPVHRKRKKHRGYNQATELAKALGRKMGIPVYDELVLRQVNTKPLKNLSRQERQNSLKKAFIPSKNVVKLNSVIIIDDIYTTGATVDAVAEVLSAMGVCNIFFVSLAIGE